MHVGHAVGRTLTARAQDVRFGARILRRTPLVTTVMVLSVALGIGVATAVFTLADVMLLRPLPFPMAERLVVPYGTVARAGPGAREDTVAWTFARYDVLRRSVRGFEDAGFATWTDAIARVTLEEQPVRVEAITRSLLTTFSIRPQAGRILGEDEDEARGSVTAAMISDRFWRTSYGASPSAIGATVLVNAVPVTIVGVMPPRFTGFTIAADLWLPLRMMERIDPASRWTARLASQWGTVIARAAPDVGTAALVKQLRAALPIVDQLAPLPERLGPDAQVGVGVMTLNEARRHPLVKPILQVMGVAVITLLAIVCANVASILLARGHARRGEMGVRIALGASRRRVGWQVLTENTLLAVLGLPAGILLGFNGAAMIANLRPALPQNWVLLRGTDLLAGASFTPDLRVLVFASVVAAIATLLFGVGPAIVASRVDAAKLITSAGDTNASPPVRGREALVVAQIALATVLLVSAGLMSRSLRALLRADLGFQAEGVMVVKAMSTDTSAAARVRRQEFLARAIAIPGITRIAAAACVPFDVSCVWSSPIHPLSSSPGVTRSVEVDHRSVSSDFFEVLRIPVVEGRGFVAEDTTDSRVRVVISATAARRLFGTASAVGKEIVFDQGGARPMEVVGVTNDVRFRSVEGVPSPAIYFLAGEDRQAPRFATTLFVRTDLPPTRALYALTQVVRSSNAPLSMTEARGLTQVVRAETSSTRFVAALLVGFALAALLLAGLGIYGVVAYVVSQRTRELGVRMVLGADNAVLLRALIGRGALLVGSGIAAGGVMALGASRLVSSFLFGIEALDVPTYLLVAALVAGIGFVAMVVPARRITRIDPARALRA